MPDLPDLTPDSTAGAPDPDQPDTGSQPQAGADVTRMTIPVSQLAAHHLLTELPELSSQFR